MFRLDGRRALVTGASGGIGGAVARTLHAQGAAVALLGRRRDALEALAAALGGAAGGATVVEADLAAGPGAADAALAAAEAGAGGGIDVLVNNAGIARDGLALRMKDEDWSLVLETNLTAAFRLGRAALKGMLRRRRGRIVNVGSVVGLTGNAGQANYAAAKAGLVGLTKALAAEVASRGVTVNCVAPGFVETAMTEGLPEAVRAGALQRIPLGRFGTGADVAAAVLYLASEEGGGYVTGQTIHVNGGLAMA